LRDAHATGPRSGAQGRDPRLLRTTRRWREGDYAGWQSLAPVQRGAAAAKVVAEGTWGGEFHPDFQAAHGDIVASEHSASSGFANTDLDLLLEELGLSKVIVIGLRANTCMESTVRQAVELGYEGTLVRCRGEFQLGRDESGARREPPALRERGGPNPRTACEIRHLNLRARRRPLRTQEHPENRSGDGAMEFVPGPVALRFGRLFCAVQPCEDAAEVPIEGLRCRDQPGLRGALPCVACGQRRIRFLSQPRRIGGSHVECGLHRGAIAGQVLEFGPLGGDGRRRQLLPDCRQSVVDRVSPRAGIVDGAPDGAGSGDHAHLGAPGDGAGRARHGFGEVPARRSEGLERGAIAVHGGAGRGIFGLQIRDVIGVLMPSEQRKRHDGDDERHDGGRSISHVHPFSPYLNRHEHTPD
jgi:hypothetical protein